MYDNFGCILSASNLFSLLFCVFLTLKGALWPSTSDHGTTGSWVMDFYWGRELYPRVFGWDVKMWTNCRMGMMGWPVLLLSYAAAQQARNGGHVTDAMAVTSSS